MVSVSEIISSLKIVDSLTGGEILHSKGLYSTVASGRTAFQKQANKLVAEGKLERGPNFYRTPDSRSNYAEHAQLITKALAEILKLPLDSIIHREVTTPIGLRPDAIVMLKKVDLGRVLIIEVINHETENYYAMKESAWANWPDSLIFLSNLFKVKVPHYQIVPVSDLVGFQSFLKEVINV